MVVGVCHGRSKSQHKYLKGDIMLEKIKNFVKSVPTTTWIVVTIGVIALAVLWAASGHSQPVLAKPAAVEAPAAK